MRQEIMVNLFLCYYKFIECPDEAVVTEKLIDHYFLSHLSPVKPKRTIKLQPINHSASKHAANKSTNR